MKLLRLFSIALVALSMTMVSCSGEDGEMGPQGIQGEKGDTGEQGVQGEQGAAGQDGADGQGFDELTQYGYITLEMEGTRVDNQAFQDSTAFKFTPIELTDFSDVSVEGEFEGETVYLFNIRRFLSAPDDVYQESYMHFQMTIADPGGENQQILTAYYELSNYAVVGDDNKYFKLNHVYDLSNAEVISGFELTDVTFDTETNEFAFSYAFTLNGASNVTGNPISMSGMADVQLLEVVVDQL